MVFEGLVEGLTELVLLVGLPLLFVLFYFEGLILGKVLQAPAVYVAVMAIARPHPGTLGLAVIGCTLAVAAGQWTVFRSFDPQRPGLIWFRGRSSRFEDLPARILDRLGEDRVATIDRWFGRYGWLAVFVSTYVPLVRMTLAVPAGMSDYSPGRFLAITLVANTTYFLVMAGLALGIVRILGL